MMCLAGAMKRGSYFERFSNVTQLIQPIERGHLVRFGQRREIEDVVDEEIDCPVEGHDGLANVDQFRRASADGVNAEDLTRGLVDQQLEHSGFVAEELASGQFRILSHAGFVWN